MANTFQCTLVTPEQELLDEQLTYASVPSWDGLVGIATQRAPLLIKLGDGPMRLDFEQGGSRWFFVGGGFAQMKDNKLALLTTQAIPASQFVREDVEAELKAAQNIQAASEQEVADKSRALTRARVMLDLLDQIGNGV